LDLNNLPKIDFQSPNDFFSNLHQLVDPEWIKGIDTNFHFVIQGVEKNCFSTIVADNELQVHESLIGEPKCVIEAKEKHFVQLLRGELNPVMALLTGKLKVSDQEEIIKHAKILGLM